MPPDKPRGQKRGAIAPVKRKPCFIAAVRYRNGDSELFRVKWADDIDDARSVLLGAVANIRTILITESRSGEPDEA